MRYTSNMEAKIYLPIPTFSVNKMYYATKKIKTKEAREWSGQVFYHLNDVAIQAELEKIRTNFDPKVHGLHVEMKAFFPPSKLFTKSEHLSGRAHDITNFEKPLVDLLFLPKYHNLTPPQGAPNLNVDDRYLLGCSSSKAAGETGIEITIKIVPNGFKN